MSETATVAVETAVEAPIASIADHQAQYGAGPVGASTASVDAADAVATEGMTEAEKADHHSAQQRRDRNTGQFDEGKKRVRPSKDIATRIGKAHEKAATAEERASAAERRAEAAERDLATLRTQRAAPERIEAAERKVEAAGGDVSDAEPNEDDPKFGGDYGKFLDAKTRWNVRDENRKIRTEESERRERASKDTAEREVLSTWAGRMKSARETHEDFEAVAFSPTPITPGSPADRFVMEDDNGPHVLYYLQSHPEERDEILGMPVLKQLKRLSLISGTFDQSSSSASGSADATGAVPARKPSYTPPKPPTPVRTEAQRGSDLADDRPALSIAEHAARFGPKRR